jgi:hypothetical protein
MRLVERDAEFPLSLFRDQTANLEFGGEGDDGYSDTTREQSRERLVDAARVGRGERREQDEDLE